MNPKKALTKKWYDDDIWVDGSFLFASIFILPIVLYFKLYEWVKTKWATTYWVNVKIRVGYYNTEELDYTLKWCSEKCQSKCHVSYEKIASKSVFKDYDYKDVTYSFKNKNDALRFKLENVGYQYV